MKQNELCPNKAIEAEARCCPGAPGSTAPGPGRCPGGTGSRAVPCFEGAHPLRRYSPVSKSEHLGKSRRFHRRCSPLSKVRTENCASSKILTPRSFGLVVTDGRIGSCGGFPVRRICNRKTLLGATPTALRFVLPAFFAECFVARDWKVVERHGLPAFACVGMRGARRAAGSKEMSGVLDRCGRTAVFGGAEKQMDPRWRALRWMWSVGLKSSLARVSWVIADATCGW